MPLKEKKKEKKNPLATNRLITTPTRRECSDASNDIMKEYF